MCFRLLRNVNDFNIIKKTENINKQDDSFNEIFIQFLDDFAPLITEEIKRPLAQRMTNSIREMMSVGEV